MLSPIVRFNVFGNSMLPSFTEGQAVLVQKRWFFCQYNIGDVIVCKNPRTGRLLIKRIQQISQKHVFVTGDNKKESTDSRHFGWVPVENTIGKVISS